MKAVLYHKVNYHPKLKDADRIKINVKILYEDEILASETWRTEEQLIDSTFDSLECFLREEAKIGFQVNDDDIDGLRVLLFHQIDEVTCSIPWCFLEMWLELYPLPAHDNAHQMDEAAQLSLDESSNIALRPASKCVVKSLNKRVYKTNTEKEETKKTSLEGCTICLQEFSDGAIVMTLPCGHDFDNECIVKWLEISSVCPVCRFQLPCEED